MKMYYEGAAQGGETPPLESEVEGGGAETDHAARGG